jgi:rod shape-determining protein MreB and related proteins
MPFHFFGKNVGIDLGTANSLIYVAGRGIVVNEPSVAAVNSKTGQILAIGEEARKMIGRTPQHINVIRPLVGGVISDFEMTQELLQRFLSRAHGSQFVASYRNAVIGVPANLTEVEQKSVEDAVLGAGVARAYVIEEALAAALGARLPVDEPTSNMIVDIGGGTTEIAIISMGGTVTSRSIKIAGDKMSDDIIKFIRDEFHLAIGEPTAEELKMTIGEAVPLGQKLEMSIRGRDLTSGLPREATVKDNHIRSAINKSLKSMVESIKEVVEVAPPELTGDVLERGIYLTGGGSLLKGIDELISKELGVTVVVVDDPLTCVARGTGIAVENLEKYKSILDNPVRPREIRI